MTANKRFQFPKHLLNQIGECSNGYFLVVLNSDNQFEVFQGLDNPVSYLGMMNFLDVFSGSMQNSMRSRPLDGGLPPGMQPPEPPDQG